MALQTARLTTVKSLSGYDFSFQPGLDRAGSAHRRGAGAPECARDLSGDSGDGSDRGTAKCAGDPDA